MTAIPSAKAAVLVIDVQVGLFCTKPSPFEAMEIIARINSVAGKARVAHVPMIFIQNDGPPEGNWLVPHTDGWQLHPDLDREQGDPVVRKKTGDAFCGTDLEGMLRATGSPGKARQLRSVAWSSRLPTALAVLSL